MDVWEKLASSMNNKSIACDLGISRKTVEFHRRRLMDKLQIHDIAGITRAAIRAGLITA